MTTSGDRFYVHEQDKGCLYIVLFLLIVPPIAAMWKVGSGAKLESFSGPTMGTRYSVSIVFPDLEVKADKLQKAVDDLLTEINRQMSTYDPDSELSRFNQYEGVDWFDVSPETAKVVRYALQVAEDSGGAFDPTVGPAVNLWGFGPDGRRRKPPNDEAIEAALARIGYHHVEARLDPPALRKSNPNVYLDLSAVAKGYAVDAVTELLAEQGIESSMVEIGGEVRTQGEKPGDIPWKIGIEQPDESGRAIREVLELEDAALATSGDYRNYFEQDGVRYSHTIDPTTGRPVQHQVATVSVVADTCMEADALATALLVMGEEKGYDWCVEHDVAAMFLIRKANDQIGQQATSAFVERVGLNAKAAEVQSNTGK
ncbi:FAD:protein FMN transferase [Bythopirellula goksoeyrii]|uniref:FAD:protein FMN transferase n=1 Tax=Bythopirellula goksoeyrii TaxID=1400387 RepID=A0A5B9QCX1_9BACT|nr:FAD:protein FMN transferase [Bythopirellula goksoeyrii]QEG35465.1 Thiamine biosynthesis lipoprotein ApbE precursor [Bythopirellula goksoeyrii]